jgi:hypothetical protein
LDAEILEEVEEPEEPEELAQPRKPQNFDEYVLPPTDFLSTPPPRIEQKGRRASGNRAGVDR